MASLLGLYIFRQQLKMKVEQGGKITMFDKAIQAGAIAVVFLEVISGNPHGIRGIGGPNRNRTCTSVLGGPRCIHSTMGPFLIKSLF